MYEETGADGRRRYTVAQIAAEFGVSQPTIYRYLGKPAGASAQQSGERRSRERVRRIRGESRCVVRGAGRRRANPIEPAEVSMTWLLLEATESMEAELMGLVERLFCRGCGPPGPVADLACVRCGDGPLLAGDLAADDLGDDRISPMVQAWMSNGGWRLSGPVCPDCVRELAR